MLIKILLVVCVVLLIISVYYNYKFAIKILNITSSLEKSLDILDERYLSISKILEIPLFYDSPQIRKVHADISKTRDSILKVANNIASIEDITEKEIE